MVLEIYPKRYLIYHRVPELILFRSNFTNINVCSASCKMCCTNIIKVNLCYFFPNNLLIFVLKIMTLITIIFFLLLLKIILFFINFLPLGSNSISAGEVYARYTNR